MNEEEYVMHYGVKGMHWYVRKDRKRSKRAARKAKKALYNKDVDHSKDEHETLPKGTKFFRVVPKSSLNSISSSPIYVTYKNTDRDFYKYGYSETIKNRNNGQPVYEKQMISNKDLKIASYRQANSIFKEALSNRELRRELNDTLTRNFIAREIGVDDSLIITKKDIDSVVKKDPYLKEKIDRHRQTKLSEVELYNFRYALGGSSKTKDFVTKKLAKQGYDGMVDMAGVGNRTSREGIDPLIIFDPKASLKEIGSEEIVSTNKKKLRRAEIRYNRLISEGSLSGKGHAY